VKRRDFLIGATGTLAAGATGCANLRELIAPNWPNIMPAEMNDFLTRQDGAMNRIALNPGSGHFRSAFERRPPTENEIRLFRQGMRSLLLVGNFGDLSLEGQVHPGVQNRLKYSAPEMDSAVLGLMDRMASLSPTARADIKLALRKDPGLADRVLEAIDMETAAVGVPMRRRLQLRMMGNNIVTRLKHSSDMLIDEYVTKCQKVAAQSGSITEMQRLLAAHMGAKALAARIQQAEAATQRWQKLGGEEIPIGYQLLLGAGTAQIESGYEQDKPLERSDKWYRTGLKMLGIGAAITGVGWILIAIGGGLGDDGEDPNAVGWVGIVLGVTVGPLTILTGLITLLIGAMIDAGDGP
jgi:hypothetical protein